MNEPELKFEIDEHGCIGYRVTNEGVLLSKDEKECIIDHVMRLQAENAKLRELVRGLDYCSDELNSAECDRCPLHDATDENLEPKCVRMMREMKI